MPVSAVELATTVEPVGERVLQPPAAPVQSTEVLITTEEVLFSTVAARGVRRDRTGHRVGGMLRRLFTVTTDGSRPRERHVARRYGFLESSLMSREMDRL